MKPPPTKRRRCRQCATTVDVHQTTGLCIACAYRAEMGDAAYERQTAPFIAEQERRRAGRRAART